MKININKKNIFNKYLKINKKLYKKNINKLKCQHLFFIMKTIL